MNAPQRNPHLHVELCTGGIDDVQLAAELQVDRIELNCGMAVASKISVQRRMTET